MSALSGSVVSSMLPLIVQGFQTDVATVEWTITVLLLVQSGLLLSFGRLGDIHGHKLIYVGGIAVFVVSSLLCGLAPSPAVLTASRAIQGVGTAMMFSAAPAIVTLLFAPAQRGRVLGFQATMVYLGLASGPPLGGWVAGTLGWRAVFFINVPAGLLTLLVAWLCIPRATPSGQREPFDLWGAALYLLGLAGLLLALNQGHVWGWTSAAVLGCLTAGLTLMTAFALVESRVASPMLDLRLFSQRAFTAPVLSAVCNYIGASATFFLVPFYLMQGRGLSPAQAGLVLTAQPVVMAVAASCSGFLSDRIGPRLPATGGMAVLSLGLLLLSRMGEAAPLSAVVGSLALVGLGIGLFTTPNNSAVLGAVPLLRRGVASGVLASARTLGFVLGVGLSGAIFSTIVAHSAGDPGGVVEATGVGLATASVIALLGVATSTSLSRHDTAEHNEPGRS